MGLSRRAAWLGLALIVALAAVALRTWIFPPQRYSMVDAPCPPRAPDAERKPVRGDLAGLCYYQAENLSLQASGARPRAVFIGDSITEYWRDRDPALFAPGMINRGITGQTSQQVLLRFRHDVIALNPQVVHIAVGTNDIAGNTGVASPADLSGNVETMIDLAKAHGIAVVVAGLFPADAIPTREDIAGVNPRIRQLNAMLADLARRRGVVFADYHAALADPHGRPRPGLTSDGLHLSRAGYAAIRPEANRALSAALAGR